MRIIGGHHKGKKISFVKSSTTRPLRDYVKENIFNIILHSNKINFDLINTNVLDLYSGTGSFGIECLSRGARNVTFVDDDQIANKILVKNIKQLKIENKCKVLNINVNNFLNSNKKKFDIIFLDPPFMENNYLEDLKLIKKLKAFNKDHIIIFHREIKKLEKISNLLKNVVIKKYGRSKIVFSSFN
ncbi:MAG: 16S rRNA (guanine(966)-N(2))-methyltransferase RsmD [Pelagibacteraceae bacterium]